MFNALRKRLETHLHPPPPPGPYDGPITKAMVKQLAEALDSRPITITGLSFEEGLQKEAYDVPVQTALEALTDPRQEQLVAAATRNPTRWSASNCTMAINTST